MKLRHVLEKISAWVDGSIKLGDSLASFDQSGHIALPWGAIKLILTVSEEEPFLKSFSRAECHLADIFVNRPDLVTLIYLALLPKELNRSLISLLVIASWSYFI